MRDANGNRIEYWIDGPGDDRVSHGISDWRRRWREAADRTPTQYAHMFWLNRARGELVIQYWSFIPSTNGSTTTKATGNTSTWWCPVLPVIHSGPASDYRAVGYEFYFHGRRLDTDRVMHAADHPVVYVGGRGACSGGRASRAAAATRGPRRTRAGAAASVRSRWATTPRGSVRMMPADSFDVVMLPEPSRLDARARPELSWLRLPFFAGQPSVFGNPPLVDRFGGGKPPRQPARRADWNSIGSRPLWSGIPVGE